MAAPPSLIVDQFGNKPWGGAYDAPKDPLAKAGVKSEAAIIYRDIPLTNYWGPWTIHGIREALINHRIGLWQQPSMLCDSVFADDRVQATLGSRTGGLFSQPLTHARGGDGRRFSHRAHREWVKQWPKICPQSVMSEIMRWVIVLGFAVAELRWDRTVTPWQPYLVPWHPYFAMYRWDLRKIQLATIDGPVAAVPGEGKWLVYTPHGEYRGWIQGAIRALAEIWFMKRLAWRDWARWNERHGLPIFGAEVPAAGDPVQKKNFITSLQTLGQEPVIGLPQNVDGTGYKATLIEARDRGWETFGNFIDRADKSIVLPILGQNLTTEVKEGSFAAARVHGDVRQNFIQFDNATLSEAIYEQVARPWALFNYGDPDVAPFSSWDVTPVEDWAVKVQVLATFATSMNQLKMAGLAPHHVAKLARRFGLDLGEIDKVAPTPVQAKAVGAGEGKESTRALRAALKDVRAMVRRLDAQYPEAA